MKRLFFVAFFAIGFFTLNAQKAHEVGTVVIHADGGGGRGAGGTSGTSAGGSGYEVKEVWFGCIDNGSTKETKAKSSTKTRGGLGAKSVGLTASRTEEISPETKTTSRRACGIYVKETN